MPGKTTSIRDVGRHAIRLNLARVAFDRFCIEGFGQVTFDELAAAAGVSRSTFLRHFRTKEDAVLFVFDPIGELTAAHLDSGVPLPDAVRRAAELVEQEAPELRAVMDLIAVTPDLQSGLAAKQAQWHREIFGAAVEAAGGDDPTAVDARLASLFACVIAALRGWAAAPADDFGKHLDRALGVVN